MITLEEIYKSIENNEKNLEILNEIKQFITEDRGIANEVITITNYLGDCIEENIHLSKSLPFNIDGITYKKGTNSCNMFDMSITVNWEYYNYIDNNLLKKYSPRKINSHNVLMKTINLTIISIHGKIVKTDMYESLQHELEHFFEKQKYNKPYKDKALHDFCNTKIRNPLTDYDLILANIVYLSRKYEQRAYANGLYQFLLKSNTIMELDNNLMETRLFQGLKLLKYYVKLLKNTDENHPLLKAAIKPYKDNFNINYHWFVKTGDNAIDNIIKIIGKTVSKVKDDLFKDVEEGIIVKPILPDLNSINKKYGFI